MCRSRFNMDRNDSPAGLTAFRREQVRLYPFPVTRGGATSDDWCEDQDNQDSRFVYPVNRQSESAADKK